MKIKQTKTANSFGGGNPHEIFRVIEIKGTVVPVELNSEEVPEETPVSDWTEVVE